MDIFNENDMNSFYTIVILPFITPFISLIYDTGPKMLFSFIALIALLIGREEAIYIVTTQIQTSSSSIEILLNIIDTPLEFWLGLILFIGADFITGLGRVTFDPLIKFNIRKFKRTAYKLIAYPTALIISGVYTNIFPDVFSLLQTFVVAILMGAEGYSIFRNLKLLAVLYVAIEFIKDRKITDLESFANMVQKKDREIIDKENNVHPKNKPSNNH